ncbi:MAG TPA: hypothetical protein VF432_22160 [Thermoanaerobaculia bacterium]
MATPGSRRVPAEQAATREQIDRAVAALTDEEVLRLERHAAWRIRGLGPAADARDAEDLVNDAFELTYSGARSWNTAVPFYIHLKGVLRSVSDHWREKYATQLSAGRGRLDASEDARTAAETAVDDPRVRAGFQDTLDAVYALFQGDRVALDILEGLAEGLESADIRAIAGLGQTPYESKVRAIRRALIDAGLKRPTVTQKGPGRG